MRVCVLKFLTLQTNSGSGGFSRTICELVGVADNHASHMCCALFIHLLDESLTDVINLPASLQGALSFQKQLQLHPVENISGSNTKQQSK